VGDEDERQFGPLATPAGASEAPGFRPTLTIEEFLVRGAEVLGVPVSELQRRRRSRGVVRACELLAALGVERYLLLFGRRARLTRCDNRRTRSAIRSGVPPGLSVSSLPFIQADPSRHRGRLS
jgi:hypothetical protein